MSLYDKIFKPREYTLSDGKKVIEKRSRIPLVVAILLVCTIISAEVTGFKVSVLFKRMNYFWQMLIDMVPPSWGYMSSVWKPLWDTIKMSLLGSFVGGVLCIPFSVVASSNIVHNKCVTAIFKFFFSVVRTLPTLVIALIATYVFGLGTLAGTIAIGFFTFAYCGKILYEQIETIDMGPYEALEALGCTKISSVRYTVLPQVMPGFIANLLYCFEGNVRYASILGYVGAGGLGLILNERIAWREWNKVGMILLALFIAVAIIEAISQYLRSKLT